MKRSARTLLVALGLVLVLAAFALPAAAHGFGAWPFTATRGRSTTARIPAILLPRRILSTARVRRATFQAVLTG